MSELVVFTLANGKQCASIIPHIYSHPSYRIRLVGHSQDSTGRLAQQYPEAEVIQCDLTQSTDCVRLVVDATTVVHVNPPFTAETEIGYNVVNALVAESRRPGNHFKHLIYSSVLHPELRKLLNHDRKRYVEEYLAESGLSHTIIQPSHLLDPYLGPVVAQRSQDQIVHRAMWEPEVRFSFLILRDLGEATAKIIVEREKHYFATYQFCSTTPISYVEVMKTASTVLGKDVKIERVGYDDAVNAAKKRFFKDGEIDPGALDAVERLLLYYNRRGLLGSPNALHWILGRNPISIEECARAMMAK